MTINTQFNKEDSVTHNGQTAVVLSVKYNKEVLYTIYLWQSETTVQDVKENELS